MCGGGGGAVGYLFIYVLMQELLLILVGTNKYGSHIGIMAQVATPNT